MEDTGGIWLLCHMVTRVHISVTVSVCSHPWYTVCRYTGCEYSSIVLIHIVVPGTPLGQFWTNHVNSWTWSDSDTVGQMAVSSSGSSLYIPSICQYLCTARAPDLQACTRALVGCPGLGLEGQCSTPGLGPARPWHLPPARALPAQPSLHAHTIYRQNGNANMC